MELKELSIEDLIQNYCLSSIQCDRCPDDEHKEEIYQFNMKLQTEISSRLKCGEENEIIIRDLKADNKAWCDSRDELLQSMAELDLKYINACKLIVDLENEVLKMKKMRKCTAQRYKVIDGRWTTIDILGVFHQWAPQYDEYDVGPGNRTVAIIEDIEGQVWECSPETVKFLESV